jgi:hypothetical protein
MEYHACLTPYRDQLGTLDMFHRWIKHLAGVGSEVVECSVLATIGRVHATTSRVHVTFS